MYEKLPPAQLYGQVRMGRVSSVDKSRHTAQVKFEELDGLTSWDLHILVTRPGDYSLYAVDTPVLCLILEGRLGIGFVLGAFYTDEDAAPLDDEGARSIAGEDIRLGDPEATDEVAKAPKVNENFDDLKTHFDAMWGVINGAVITEAGLGQPSALQAALKGVLAGSPYPQPLDVAAENVTVK